MKASAVARGKGSWERGTLMYADKHDACVGRLTVAARSEPNRCALRLTNLCCALAL
jgi:hypothetical protein